jgi:hypothetical protein
MPAGERREILLVLTTAAMIAAMFKPHNFPARQFAALLVALP